MYTPSVPPVCARAEACAYNASALQKTSKDTSSIILRTPQYKNKINNEKRLVNTTNNEKHLVKNNNKQYLTKKKKRQCEDGSSIIPWTPPSRQFVQDKTKLQEFDILVIGGGATGSGVALDAATRGLKVALVSPECVFRV